MKLVWFELDALIRAKSSGTLPAQVRVIAFWQVEPDPKLFAQARREAVETPSTWFCSCSKIEPSSVADAAAMACRIPVALAAAVLLRIDTALSTESRARSCATVTFSRVGS